MERRLLALSPDDPSALYAAAYARLALIPHKEVGSEAVLAAVALLNRCIAQGDEPKGRCMKRRAELMSDDLVAP